MISLSMRFLFIRDLCVDIIRNCEECGGKQKIKMPFNIVSITDNENQVMMNSIEKYFIWDEPLNASVALFKEERNK